MPEKITIIDTRESPSSDAKRMGGWDLLVLYSVGEGTPAAVRVPAEKATDETVQEAIKADLAKRATWKGKTFEV